MNETGSNYFTSVIRTVVPTLWGTALAWLVSVGILDQAAADGPGTAAGGFLVTIAVGGYYIVARWIEAQTWSPAWLSGILLGRPVAPAYEKPAPPAGPRGVDAEPYIGEHRERGDRPAF